MCNDCLFINACRSVGARKAEVAEAIFALGDLKRRALKCWGSGSPTTFLGGDEPLGGHLEEVLFLMIFH